MEVVTIWLAVDDSIIENGCMRVIPGTQKLDLKPLHENKNVDNVLGSEMEKKYVDETKAVNIELNSGSVSIHHPKVIHGSKANHSALRRCGLTIRYIPTSTRIVSEVSWPSAFLLRGESKGRNDYWDKPKYDKDTHMPFRDSFKYE